MNPYRGCVIYLFVFFFLNACREDLNFRRQQPEDSCQVSGQLAWLDKMDAYGRESHISPEKYEYNWSDAVFLKAMMSQYENSAGAEKEKYLNYIKSAMDHVIDDVNGGTINDLASACGLAFLYKATGDPLYLQKANRVYNDFTRLARAANGGVSHIYGEVQLWDDAVFMMGVFLLEMYKATGDMKYINAYVDQVLVYAKVLVDEESKLWYHAWDEDGIDNSREGSLKGWPDPVTHRSEEFWGRGNGWVAVSLSDALETIAPNFPRRDSLEVLYVGMMHTLKGLQDQKSGHWFQLPAYPYENGNFLESSCTAMYGYAMAKGIQMNLLAEQEYLPVVERAAKGLCQYSVEPISNSYAWPVNVCVGTSVGDKNYYYNRSIVSGTGFAFGIFVLFGIEVEKLWAK